MIGFNGYLDESKQIEKATERLAKDRRVQKVVRNHGQRLTWKFMNALLAIPLVNKIIFDISPQKLNTAGQVASNLRRVILGEEYAIHDDDMEQFLTESFDRPYTLKSPPKRPRMSPSNSYTTTYKFTTDDKRKFEVDFASYIGPLKLYNRDLDKDYHFVEISFSDETNWYTTPRFGLSGKGDAMRIFATVLSAISTFTKNFKPDEIEFGADKTSSLPSDSEYGSVDTNRARLYQALIKRHAPRMGYKLTKLIDKDNEFVFTMKRR